MVYSRLEYIWIDNDYHLRSKIKVMEVTDFNNIPEWNYDGSSTNQATTDNSEVVIKPRKIFTSANDKQHLLVLCDTYDRDGNVLQTNNRNLANDIFNKNLKEKPWFGMEQEYFFIDSQTGNPLGFNENKTQGQYYCSVGAENAFGRTIAEQHMLECINYGIKISGINAEVAPGQWEFQIGPCEGIEAGDHLWVARYLLYKITEKHNIIVNIDPKPVGGDWNGSGCHTNYSTKSMREGNDNKDGLHFINEAINKLSQKHEEHMKVYGTGNELRMTGKHETSSYNVFSYGISNRGASIRIGTETYKNKKGYFEDRRPSSNCDPYLVTSKLFETTVIS
jgi:glutamine synthetase